MNISEDKKNIYIVFGVCSFIFLLLLIVVFKKKNREEIQMIYKDEIILIKAENKDIKVIPIDKGGLEIDNVDMNIYNVLDNEDHQEVVSIKKEETVIELDDSFSLEAKIAEIQENDNEEMKNDKIIETKKNIDKAKIVKKIDYDLLKEKVKNNSLINNIKNNKIKRTKIYAQILSSRSEKDAIKFWQKVSKEYKEIFESKGYEISSIEIENKGIFYRLKVSGFSDKSDARKFCDKYVNASKKDKFACIVY